VEEAADAALARTAATLQSATAVTTFFMVGLGVVVSLCFERRRGRSQEASIGNSD
jgi:hypothetical protein